MRHQSKYGASNAGYGEATTPSKSCCRNAVGMAGVSVINWLENVGNMIKVMGTATSWHMKPLPLFISRKLLLLADVSFQSSPVVSQAPLLAPSCCPNNCAVWNPNRIVSNKLCTPFVDFPVEFRTVAISCYFHTFTAHQMLTSKYIKKRAWISLRHRLARQGTVASLPQ